MTPDRCPLEVRAKELIGLPEEEPTTEAELPSLSTITRNLLNLAGDLPLGPLSLTPPQLGKHSITFVPPVVPQPARPAFRGEIALLATVDDPVDKKSIFSPEELDKDQKFNILRRTGELRRRPKTGGGFCPAILGTARPQHTAVVGDSCGVGFKPVWEYSLDFKIPKIPKPPPPRPWWWNVAVDIDTSTADIPPWWRSWGGQAAWYPTSPSLSGLWREKCVPNVLQQVATG